MILWLTQISRKTRKPGPMIMAHTDLTNLTDGKSLRPCLSAAPSACLAHAENAENADFASRYALAASGMYTLGETPTHASLRCVLREIREICVRQNNQREGNGKRAGWQAQAKRVCLCEFCALCVRQKNQREAKNSLISEIS